MKSQRIGLTPEDWSALMEILQNHVPDAEIWAFGSRVQGTARPFSDLDLVLVKDQPLDAATRAELNYALSESNLPIRVDILEWARTSQPFRRIILQNYVVLKTKAA